MFQHGKLTFVWRNVPFNIINVYSISGNLTCQNIYCIFYIIFYHCYYNNLCMLVHGVLDM